MQNDYLEFYEKHKVSPVKQDIQNLEAHTNRRLGLLRQLGIHYFCIKGKKILEVGPGGGFNSLAINNLHPKSLTLVEPNTTGYKELLSNLKDYRNIYSYNMTLEEFSSNVKEKYDVVFCEGLIQGLTSKEIFINILKEKVSETGILVITVADEISIFFEIVRKLLSNIFLKDIKDFEKKIELMKKIFKKDLDSLIYMTRMYEDWCIDLMGDAYYNHTFSISDALKLLEKDFFLLGSSPNIMTDFRWYKSLSNNYEEYNNYFYQNFNKIKHSFLDYRTNISERSTIDNDELSSLCKEFIKIVKTIEKNKIDFKDTNIVEILKKIKDNVLNIDKLIDDSIDELINLLEKPIITVKDIEELKYLSLSFGKGQIFLSFSKK